MHLVVEPRRLNRHLQLEKIPFYVHMQRMSISLKRGTEPVTVQTTSISNIYSSNRNMTVL